MGEKKVKDGYLLDYISGIEIKATPEEVDAVQVFSKQLVEDYGYPKEFIQTRPQHRVKVRPSDVKKEYPVDIAVFKNKTRNDDQLYIVVECKKKNRKDGRTQLQDYMRLSLAELGVWFNGNERIFLRKVEKAGKVIFDEIPNIPRYKQRIEDIGLFKRKDLKPTHNLKATFKSIRNYLAGNSVGTTRDEMLAQQLINIIFCKIYDERFTAKNDTVLFRAGIGEKPVTIKKRINDLFIQVKRKYKEVLDEDDKITLDPKSIAYVVGELQNYCLIESERDVVADAFETFIGHALKGGQGQFFTPRNIIQLIIDFLDPTEDDLVIDPACGTGGFLIETLRHMWHKLEEEAKEYNWNYENLKEEKMSCAIKNIKGIDKDYFLAKVAKAYMAIMGDGKGGIFNEDSLELIKNWGSKTKAQVGLDKFDIVVTNPPFGTSIKVSGEDKLNQYELAHKWKKNQDTGTFFIQKLKSGENPQILFLERCLQLLKDGGKMGIILPETYFHGPSLKYVMQYLEDRHNIMGIIDLPHNTFRPHCNAKTLALFVQKNTPQQDKIIFGVAEEMGHNHQGKITYRFDENTKEFTDELWDDTINIRQELKNPEDPNNKYVFTISKEKIVDSIYVPRYYWDVKVKKVIENATSNGYQFVTLGELEEKGILKCYRGHGSPKSEFKGRGDVFYVRAGDVTDWDIYKNPVSAIPYDEYLRVKGKGVDLQVKDIVFVKEGSYRVGDVAILSPSDTNILLNHHSFVFRIIDENNEYGIDAFYLLYLISHEYTKIQLPNKVMIDTTLPNIGNRWKELKLPVLSDQEKRDKLKKKLQKYFKGKWGAESSFYKIKDLLKIK